MEGFAERAERELSATGERARKRTVDTREDLTAREAQIARPAGEGFSNPEIGARLFISPKTVEYRGPLARECLMHGEPVTRGEPCRLVAAQDVVATK